MWERANGKSKRMLKLVQLPESFEVSFEFEHEIETAEPLLFMLRRFLEQLTFRLSAIYLVAQELTLRISFADKRSPYERVFKIPQPTNDVDLLFRMLQAHLEDFRSEQPIVAVALSAEPIKPASQQFGLFETTLRNPQQLYETLARLTGLLGPDRVGMPVLEETHRPDAFRMEPFAWVAVSAALSGQSPDALRTAHTTIALRRFRPAAPASIFTSQNRHLQSDRVSGKIDDSPPALSHSRASRLCRSAPAGSIVDQHGPYLLSGNWWDEKSWGRAEWDVELEHGVLYRSYQNLEGAWEIDGIYD
jgi:protein ImuB